LEIRPTCKPPISFLHVVIGDAMLSIISLMNDWAEGWLTVMWAVVWQLAVVVVIASVIAWLLRRSSPAVRYWLWQIVAIKLLLMPFWSYAIPLPSWSESKPVERSAAIQPPQNLGQDAFKPEFPLPRPAADSAAAKAAPPATPFWEPLSAMGWQAWLLLAWCVVVLWQVVRLLGQRLRLARLLGRASPAGGELSGLVAELAERVRIRRVPAAVSVEGDCPLFVCGLWRTRLVLPSRLMASLGAAERQQVILHELAHVKRRDLVWGWPAEIARIVYSFHPLVYWVAYQLRLERELACDQLAMARSGHTAADYAQTLVQVVSHGSQPPQVQVAAISAGLSGSEPSPKQQSQSDHS
jgi:beta-lactamase regulating signal transducer with metallopeptidase domain